MHKPRPLLSVKNKTHIHRDGNHMAGGTPSSEGNQHASARAALGAGEGGLPRPLLGGETGEERVDLARWQRGWRAGTPHLDFSAFLENANPHLQRPG